MANILFNTQFAWPFSAVDMALAKALALRGQTVRVLLCGGLPRYCEQQIHFSDRPSCADCVEWAQAQCRRYGLEPVFQCQHYDEADVRYASDIAETMPVRELLDLTLHAVPIGTRSRYNLLHHDRRFPHEITGQTEELFRRIVHSAILMTLGVSRIIDELRIDAVVSADGKFAQWSAPVQIAKARGLTMMTWDDMYRKDVPHNIFFSLNDIAGEMRLDGIWESRSGRPLSARQQTAVHDYYLSWSRGETSPYDYHQGSRHEAPEVLRERLGIPQGAPLVAAFPNMLCDGAVLGIEAGFSSIFHWLGAIIDEARKRPHIAFVIRSHPGEAKVEQEYNRCRICTELQERHGPFPPNLHCLPGEADVSSYALCEAADAALVYASTLGLELALRGTRPWVSANVYYAGKGFTLDVMNPETLASALDGTLPDKRLPAEAVEQAERFAYALQFERGFDFPLQAAEQAAAEGRWEFFQAGGHPVLEEVAAALLHDVEANPEKTPRPVCHEAEASPTRAEDSNALPAR